MKIFWKHINFITKSNSLPSVLHRNNVYCNDSTEAFNLLAEYLESTYNYTAVDSHANGVHYESIAAPVTPLNFNSIEITIDDISKNISELDIIKGATPDQIPNLLIKNCQYTHSYPLFIIFVKSLSSSTFSRFWKSSKTCLNVSNRSSLWNKILRFRCSVSLFHLFSE